MHVCNVIIFLISLSHIEGSFKEMKTYSTSKLVGVVWLIQRFAHVETTVCTFETACRFKELAEPLFLFSELQRSQLPFTLDGLEVVFHTFKNQALISGDLHTAVPKQAVCAQLSCCINNSRDFAKAFHLVLSQLQFVSSF